MCFNILDKEVERLRKMLQVEIGHLMGSTTLKSKEWLNTLRDWLLGFSAVTSSSSQGSIDNVKRILFRNRAHVLNAQEKRMRRLQNEMYFAHKPFPPGRVAHGIETHVPISTTKSLDDYRFRQHSSSYNSYNHCSPFSTLGTSTKPSNCSVSRVFLKAISGDCVYENAHPTSDFMHVKEENDGQYFYDSDPGEIRLRNRFPKRATALEPSAPFRRRPLKETLPVDEPDIDNDSAAYSLSSSEDEDNLEKSHSYDELVIDVRNDEVVTKFTRELTNGNVTLVWHPSKSQNRENRSPICVQAWFEMGSRLRDKVIQPKFMWWAAYQPDIAQKKLSISTHTPESVELLNIVRVLKPTYIDREQYPFAKQRNCFTIHSNTNEEYLFEVFSEKERNRFVQGLKLVVARLASKIIVGDEDVFDEFFTP